MLKRVFGVAFVLAVIGLAVTPMLAQKPKSNGTTLAGYKTMDICNVADAPTPTWRYSGEIAVWNQGALDTVGFTINDCLQAKTISGGGQFADVFCTAVNTGGAQIPAGTTELTATTFNYSFDRQAYPVDQYYVKNVANMTILNHSGSLNTPFGPSPKVTWDGGVPADCDEGDQGLGCTYTQGYWGNKPGVVWSDAYSRTATFFLATKNGLCTANCGGNPNDDVFEQLPKTWQEVMDSNVSLSQGYYQLAHQYIAAVLNIEKTIDPAVAPEGVQDTLELAADWLAANAPSACTVNGSCGTQKDWAAVLATFNEGVYPDGPPHCIDETVPGNL